MKWEVIFRIINALFETKSPQCLSGYGIFECLAVLKRKITKVKWMQKGEEKSREVKWMQKGEERNRKVNWIQKGEKMM